MAKAINKNSAKSVKTKVSVEKHGYGNTEVSFEIAKGSKTP